MSRLFGAPELAAGGDGRLGLFVFDADGALWHIFQTQWSGGWSNWILQRDPDPDFVWPVAVEASGDGRLEVFTLAGGFVHQSQTAWSGGWSAWTTIAGPPSGAFGFYAPGIAANADGRLEAFVADGSLWRMEQTAWSNGFSGWLPHGAPRPDPGGNVAGPVAAGRSGDGRVEVFVIALNGSMWNIRQTRANGGWSGWNDLGSAGGGGFEDRPAVARNADGRLELFAKGTDGVLWRRRQLQVSPTTGWSDWVSEGAAPGGALIDHPVVGRSPDGHLEVFMTAVDGNVWHKRQTAASGGWGPWTSEGSAGVGFHGAAPGLGRSGDGRFELFAVGDDGALWHKWQTAANNGWSGWVSYGQPNIPPPMTTVPDVFQLRAPAARAEVVAAHLVPEFGGTNSASAWVSAQSPLGGRTVAEGTTVHMTLRTGPIQ
jgi:hypothetical protein